MAERDTRIRWTGRERDLVVNEYRTLCASNLVLPMLELLVAAQKSLPKERQRPPSYALRAWFNKELKAARERPGKNGRGQLGNLSLAASTTAPTTTAPNGGDVGARPRGSEATSPTALEQSLTAALRAALYSPLSSVERQRLTETGVEIMVGVLENPRVQQALGHFLSHAQDERFATPRVTFQTSVSQGAKLKVAATEPAPSPAERVPRSGKMRVLIAGPAEAQLADVRAPYDAQLELESWSPDQGFEQLRMQVDSVDVVIGMPSLLTQAVQNTLRHYARRYIRHTAGIAGLGGELAKLLAEEAK